MKKNQLGFAVLELVVLVVVVAAVGLVGYKVIQAGKSGTSKESVSTLSNSLSGVPSSVPSIAKTDDLTQAQKTLDEVDPDANSSDLSQLDSQLNGF